MSNAPNYIPNVSFASEETDSVAGRSTVRTVAVDTELANASSSINAINTNLQLIQRDDGRLKDLSIEPFMLSEQVKSLLAARGTIRGLWQPSTEYKRGEIVQYLTSGFVSLYDHTSSGLFNYSLWLALSGDGTATQKAIEAAASAASSLANANSADISEAAAMIARVAAETAQAIAEAMADAASADSIIAEAAKNTSLSAANSAQLNANAAAAEALAAEASADLAYQYSLLASPIQYAVTTGTSSAYEATLTVPIVGYADEQTFKFRFDQDCATNATLRISGVNPPLDLKIQDAYGDYINVFAGDIIAGHYAICTVILNGTALLVESAIDVNTRVGCILDFTGTAPLPNTIELPLVPTNISRTTYHRLFAVIGTAWGVGDGSTTFGCPYMPANYAAVRANANVGSATVGENLAHSHSLPNVFIASSPNGFAGAGGAGLTSNVTGSSGGAANLAAGIRVMKLLVYR